MAPLIGREMTERLFLERFTRMCADALFQVRKVCASNFGEFCAVVGTQLTEDVLVSMSIGSNGLSIGIMVVKSGLGIVGELVKLTSSLSYYFLCNGEFLAAGFACITEVVCIWLMSKH